MSWTATALTSLSSDTEPSILLTFETGKYIFNAGEGTNRALVQGKQSFKKTRGIFFTDVLMRRVGGIAGLLMSFADATITNLKLVGPPGLFHYLASMRLYTFRDSLHVKSIESTWEPAGTSIPEPLFKDVNITVYGIPIVPGSIKGPNISNLEVVEELSEVGSKRRRSPSLDYPVKRPSLDPDCSDSVIPSDPEMKSSPVDSQEFRKLLISHMFTGKFVEEEISVPDRDRKCKRKTKDEDKDKPTPKTAFGLKNSQPIINELEPPSALGSPDKPQPFRRKRGILPEGFFEQLPQFRRHLLLCDDKPRATPTLAYAVVGPRVRGRFNVQKAEELGVFGRNRGRLTDGETVTVYGKVDGQPVTKIVRPDDVIAESEAPKVALILDIPTPEHIPCLISSFTDNPFYAKFRSVKPEDVKEFSVSIVFHLCGKGVLEDPRYIEFMNGFIPTVQHIISSSEHSPDFVTFTSAAFNQLRLNRLDPDIFPVHKFCLTPKRSLQAIPSLPATARLMVANQYLRLRPHVPLKELTHEESGDRFHPVVTSSASPPLGPRTLELFVEAQTSVQDYMEGGRVYTPNGADVKIIPFGTGSAVPTKYRNVSATLVQIPNFGNVLLDAGEGTWGQMARQFGLKDGPGNVWDVLRNLKCIFASHVHGDHHMGIALILSKRRELDPPPSEPLYLVSIRAVHLYLREISDLQDLGFNDPSGNGVISIMSEAIHWKKPTEYPSFGMWKVNGKEPWLDINESKRHVVGLCRSLGLESFETVDMMHRTRCFGSILKHQDDWSLVFSADTAPSNALANAGRDATVLIHEATMDNDQVEMAAQKAHSTFGQALNTGRKMNAEHVLLTHFSARYPKMPPSGVKAPDQIEEDQDDEMKLTEPIVALAFDHANLTIGTLWKVNYYLKAIEQCMRDTAEEEGNDNEGVDEVNPNAEVAVE